MERHEHNIDLTDLGELAARAAGQPKAPMVREPRVPAVDLDRLDEVLGQIELPEDPNQ